MSIGRGRIFFPAAELFQKFGTQILPGVGKTASQMAYMAEKSFINNLYGQDCLLNKLH
jgi:hypothetical protein